MQAEQSLREGRLRDALAELQAQVRKEPAASLPMVQTYREAIRCELFRADVFAGRRSPLVFGDPEPWVALLLEALRLTADGHYARARATRDQAFESATVTP